jgi:hypothetical protein
MKFENLFIQWGVGNVLEKVRARTFKTVGGAEASVVWLESLHEKRPESLRRLGIEVKNP